MAQRMPNFSPVIRGVPRQQGASGGNGMARRMARNTGAGGAVDFVPGSSCTPNWNQPPIELNENGCPTSWNGCGDKVFAKWTLPANSTTTQIITAPFSMVACEAICSAVDAAGALVTEGQVLWNQAKTANSGTSIFGTDSTGGVDITFFYRDSFFSRLINVPIYANQPGGERVLVNTTGNIITVYWTEIGQSAHMLPGYND